MPSARAAALSAGLVLALVLAGPPVAAQEAPPTAPPSEPAGEPPPPPPGDTGAPPAPEPVSAAVGRLSGATRYATAGMLGELFEGGGPVYIASGQSFPDALAGGPAASLDGAPLLLVTRDGIPAETRTRLDAHGPSQITVLGGPGTVSAAVEAELRGWAPVTRVAGADRYATAAAISRRAFPDGARGVLVATGQDFPDALSGATRGAAGSDTLPVLLTGREALPEPTRAEIERLAPDFVVVLGGSGTVSDAVLAALQDLAPEVVRLAGANRYDTSAEVAALYPLEEIAVVFVATGLNFPDALAVAPVAGAFDSPTLLVPPTGALPPATRAALERMTSLQYVAVLGGPAAVSDSVLAEITRTVDGG